MYILFYLFIYLFFFFFFDAAAAVVAYGYPEFGQLLSHSLCLALGRPPIDRLAV